MIRKWLALGITMAIGLIACDKEDRSPVQPDGKEGKGSANIALPKLPAGYLADSGQKALFSLTITGSGMDPIMKSWYLYPDRSQSLLVEGIPVGERHFYGRLIRIDAKTGDTTVTHEGSDSAFIERGAVTDVHLYLRAGGYGSAHLCVEVEGWPADPTCIPPPPPLPIVEGCYQVQVKPNGSDSMLTAWLRVVQKDTGFLSYLTWATGEVDTASGRPFSSGPTAYFGVDGKGDFLFKAYVDSLGNLSGAFQDEARGIIADMAIARRSDVCGPDTLPPPRPNVAGCYALVVAKSGPVQDSLFHGRLSLTQRDSLLFAVLEWGSGAKDTTNGIVTATGVVSLGMDGSQFSLKATYDSAAGLTRGYFGALARGIYGRAAAAPVACAAPVPPNQTVQFDSVRCWKVLQRTVDGRAMEGTLLAGRYGKSLIAWFQWDWNSTGFAMDNGTSPVSGGTLYLYGTLPRGFAHPARNAIEAGHYKARVGPTGQIEAGAAYAHAGAGEFTSGDKFAEWDGSAYVCPDDAREALAVLRKP